MAFTISPTNYFTSVNAELDHLQQIGGCPSRSRAVERITKRLHDSDFTKRVVERYSLLTDEMLLDYHENEYITLIVQNYAHRYAYNKNIEVTLRSFGLRAEKARTIRRLFEPLEGESYTNRQIIDMAIEYVFGLGIHTIGKVNEKYCIHPEKMAVWFEMEKPVYNFPGSCIPEQIKNIYQAIHALESPSADYDFYYHTTDWEGGLSILEGINHEAGRKCLDFGLYPSFYVGPHLKDAIEWAGKRSLITKNESAIFIFRIPKIKPSNLHYKELVGDEWTSDEWTSDEWTSDEWAALTKKSRICVPRLYNELRELRNIDLIHGPMVSNANGVASLDEKPRMHTQPKYQLASKTNKADDFLYECMIGAIFFQK